MSRAWAWASARARARARSSSVTSSRRTAVFATSSGKKNARVTTPCPIAPVMLPWAPATFSAKLAAAKGNGASHSQRAGIRHHSNSTARRNMTVNVSSVARGTVHACQPNDGATSAVTVRHITEKNTGMSSAARMMMMSARRFWPRVSALVMPFIVPRRP